VTRIKTTPLNLKCSQSLRRGIAVPTLMVALSLPWGSVSLLAHRADQAIRQRHAVEVIRAGGGYSYYDFQTKGGKVLASPRPPGPAWLRNIVGIDYLATVDVVTWMDADDRDRGLNFFPIVIAEHRSNHIVPERQDSVKSRTE
jgi:hypothetical protein